jgi:lipoprotein NlpD
LLVIGLASCGTRTGPAPVYEPTGPAPPGFYRIRYGDTLSGIAERRDIPLAALAGWNDLEPPYKILAGDLLRIEPPPQRLVAEVLSAPRERRTKVEPEVSTQARPEARAVSIRSAPSTPALKPKTASRPATRPAPTKTIDWRWPVSGRVIRRFDINDPARQGIRIAAREGAHVVAAAPGEVVYSGGGLKAYGDLIIISHTDDYLSAYGLNRRRLVTKGEKVARGQPIAEVGRATAEQSQLHFEIRRDGAAVDPLKHLPAGR